MKFNSINREILALSIPSIIANITTPLLGLVDVAIVGNMGSAVYIAAIAIGGTIFNMLYWPFAFLRMGSSGMTAQAFGANDSKQCSLVLYRSLLVAMTVGFAIIALQYLIAQFAFLFMDISGDTLKYSQSYFSVCIWGAPAMLGSYALSGWFIGMQNSRATMWISIFINLLNISTSLTLVYLFNMGITGVAIGTLTAQWGGFLLGLIIVWIKYTPKHYSLQSILNRNELKRFFSINSDIFLRTICLVTVTLWFTRAGAQQSDIILAVNTLLMQLFILFSYFMDGFAYAGEALAGKYIGAKQPQQLKACIKSLFHWGIAMAILFTLIYLIGGESFLALLSSDVNVVNASSTYFPWAIAIPLCGFAAFTWDGIFIGATRTRAMLMSMATAMVCFFVIYFTLYPTMANHALWLAFISYLVIRGIVLYIIYLKKPLITLIGNNEL